MMTYREPEVRPHARPTPVPIESPFSRDELFFSTTDLKGIIRSGNRVFMRTSKYARQELVGSAHNIIRHPDMPRLVFRLLWEELKAGRPIAAYVKNMASDGSYYWVLATVVPYEGGYLSVRAKPSTQWFDAAQRIYADLLQVERNVEAGDPKRRDASIEAARARLDEHLRASGFDGYEAFMRTALLAEVQAHDVSVTSRRASQASSSTAAEPTLNGVLAACLELDQFLGTLVARVDAYTALNTQLVDEANRTADLAEDVQLFSLNARLAATRTDDRQRTLETVTSQLQLCTSESAPTFRLLVENVVDSAGLLDAMLLPVGIARMQAQALLVFVLELLEGRDDERATADDLGILARCLIGEVDHLTSSLAQLSARLGALASHVADLKSSLSSIRRLELNGRIEASHVADAGSVVRLFQSIAKRIEQARHDLSDIDRCSRFSLAREIAASERCRRHLDVIRASAEDLARQPVAHR